MKKYAYLAWMLLMMPTENKVTFTLNNHQIQITSNEPFNGEIYHDDELFYELKEVQTSNIDIEEGGIYSLFNDQEELIEKIIVLDEKDHIAFSEKVQQKKDNKYLFKKKPITWIIKEGKVEEYEVDTFVFLEEMFEIVVDDSIPQIQFEDMVKIEENVFITNNTELPFHYEDTYPDGFEYFSSSDFLIELNEGLNDLSKYIKDMANNQSREELWVICDTTTPFIHNAKSKMHISKPTELMIEESHLDVKNSYYLYNGKKFEIKNNQILLSHNGTVEIYLIDYAGNENKMMIDVVFDVEKPKINHEIVNQILKISFNEAVDKEDIYLSYNGEVQTIKADEGIRLNGEGVYYIVGTAEDLAGNISEFEEKINVDWSSPDIQLLNDVSNTLHEKTQLSIKIEDIFLKQWEIKVYKENRLIHSANGYGNGIEKVIFEENHHALYRVEIFADDGVHQSSLSRSYLMDTGCAPINLKVNGYFADNVTSLILNNELLLQMNCQEGTVYWQLFKEDGSYISGNDSKITINPDENYTHIKMSVTDKCGYTQEKTISFEKEKTLFKDKSKEKPESNQKQAMSVEPLSDQKLHNERGILIAIASLFGCIFGYIRFRKYKSHLSIQQTIPLSNSQDTVVLPVDSKNQTETNID